MSTSDDVHRLLIERTVHVAGNGHGCELLEQLGLDLGQTRNNRNDTLPSDEMRDANIDDSAHPALELLGSFTQEGCDRESR